MKQEVIPDIYHQFQQYLDEYLAIPFPSTKYGARSVF